MTEKKVRLKMKVNNRIPRSLIGLHSGSYESTGIKKSSHITPKIRQRISARTKATVLAPKIFKNFNYSIAQDEFFVALYFTIYQIKSHRIG